MSASAKLRGISKQTQEGRMKAVNQFDLSGKVYKTLETNETGF